MPYVYEKDKGWKKSLEKQRLRDSLCKKSIFVLKIRGVRRGASKGVEDGCRPTALWAGLPIQCKMYPIEKGCDQLQTSSL
jgi:hypothetical protein